MNIKKWKMKKKKTKKKPYNNYIPTPSDKTLAFLLLNTRWFPKHGIDITKDKRLYQDDILCLTETHVTPEQNTNMTDQH